MNRILTGRLRNPAKCPTRAFTLIEMLAAVTVFALMMGLLSQLLSTTVRVTHFTHQEMNAADATRQVLDSLATDLENMVNVNGLTLLVSEDTNNNAVLAFLTRSRGPSNQVGVRCMAVAYQLSGGQVTRSVSPILWATTNLAGSTIDAASSTTTSVITSNGLRLEAVIILDNGTTVPLAQLRQVGQTAAWKTSVVNGEQLQAGYYGLVLSASPIDPNNPRVSGIMIGVAALDEQSFKLANASQMGSSLPSPTGSQTPIDTWSATRATVAFLHDYPAPAIAALNMGQQLYPLK